MVFIIGLLILIYGLIVLMIIGANGWFNYFCLALGSLILILSYRWKSIKNIVNKHILNTVIFFITIGILLFICLETKIIIQGNKKPIEKADYVILLGAQVKESGPSIDYQARIESAYEYLIDNPNSKIIVTGAKGNDEPMSEALAAKIYLTNKGIKEDRIILEDKSFSTYENIYNSKTIIENSNEDPNKIKIVIVSASYHLTRAKMIANRIGFKNVATKGSHGLLILMPHYYIREFFAYLKDFVYISVDY